MPCSAASVFQLVLIKPTHYDDDGYPIQWFRSAIPSNTLACLNGLAEDAHLPEMPQDMREAQALGISFFAGEAEEGRFDAVLRDAWDGKLAPLYNHMDKLPNLQGEPPPILPRQHLRRTSGSLSSMDLGRGCPYQCSFCTIINVHGRKSRFRSPDDLERI